MYTALDLVANEIGQSRRRSAQEAARGTAVRLAHREERLRRRMSRVSGQLAAENSVR